MVAIIAGRLYYLAYYLEELDEPAEAQKYREFISLEAIGSFWTSTTAVPVLCKRVRYLTSSWG